MQHDPESRRQIARRRSQEALEALAEINRGGLPKLALTLQQRPTRRGLAARPIRTRLRRPGRNDPCPCGSGAKFKRCCGRR